MGRKKKTTKKKNTRPKVRPAPVDKRFNHIDRADRNRNGCDLKENSELYLTKFVHRADWAGTRRPEVESEV